jgi:hypothetical protein
MKRLLPILLFALASCKGCDLSTYHEKRYSPDGKDSVAYVFYYDGQQFNNFYVPYSQFVQLHKDGGYEAVYEYYLDHQLSDHDRELYKTYKKK